MTIIQMTLRTYAGIAWKRAVAASIFRSWSPWLGSARAPASSTARPSPATTTECRASTAFGIGAATPPRRSPGPGEAYVPLEIRTRRATDQLREAGAEAPIRCCLAVLVEKDVVALPQLRWRARAFQRSADKGKDAL